jgi:hypothetical protein
MQLWERRKPCTIFGTLGTDARNAPRDVRIVICTSLIECVIKMEAISTVQRMVSAILYRRTGRENTKFKVEK